MKLRHICEVCGKEEILTPEEAHMQGWDYPPMIGTFGIVSPRTCGNCTITDTVWWKLMNKDTKFKDLTVKELETINRIVHEPESILVED